MKTSVPIYLEERDGEVCAHPLFDNELRVLALKDRMAFPSTVL